MDNYSVVIIGSSSQSKEILDLFGSNTEIYENYKVKLNQGSDGRYIEDEAYLIYNHIKTLFANGRRMKTKVIVTIQSPKDLTPILRVNTDTVIIFKNDGLNYCKEIYESYSLYSDLSFELFDKTIQTLNDYNYLVIDKLTSFYNVNSLI